MEDYGNYAREGAMAGASVGAVGGAWSGLIGPIIYHFLISSVQLDTGFLFQYSIFSAISGAFSGAIVGIPLSLILMILNDRGVIEEDRKSAIKYGISVSVLFSIIIALGLINSARIDKRLMIALISLGTIHGAIFLGLWGHWIGKSIYAE